MRYSGKAYWGWSIAGLVLGIGGSAAIVLLVPGLSWAALVAITAVIAVAFGFVLLAFRHADEVILNTQKTAAFWGTMVAACAAGPLIFAFAWHLLPLPLFLQHLRHLLRPDIPQDTRFLFIDGMVFMMLLQLAGWIVFGTYQYFRRPKP